MKNLQKWIIFSSLCATSIVSAQNYGNDPYSQNSNTNNQNYPSSQSYSSIPQTSGQQYQRTQYPNNGYGAPNSNYSYQKTTYQEAPASNTNDQGTWSNWMGTDNTPKIPDEVITTRVIQNLRSTPYFSSSAKNIQVLTKDGKVTLKGKVANSNEKNQIDYMVKNVEGVKSVSNDLDTEK